MKNVKPIMYIPVPPFWFKPALVGIFLGFIVTGLILSYYTHSQLAKHKRLLEDKYNQEYTQGLMQEAYTLCSTEFDGIDYFVNENNITSWGCGGRK